VTRAVLSLGANLGDRAAALRTAVAALKDDGVLVARSTLYETPPWGPVEQPPYLNAVVVVRGDRDAAGWLARAHELEQAAGRTRDVRWGPRTLDVDVVTVTGDAARPRPGERPAGRAATGGRRGRRPLGAPPVSERVSSRMGRAKPRTCSTSASEESA
jgi:2-amino-4-hydroxy-6-hydroxymethyldihydropteridine diphosphokinase